MGRASLIIPSIRIFAVLFVITALGPAVAQDIPTGTIGYDCGREIRNFTTISLLDIDDCDLKPEEVNTTSEDVLLLQLNKYEHLKVIQCKVEIARQVFYCGMSSHNSIIHNAEYIYSITRDVCQNAHNYGTLNINNILLKDLQVNMTVSHPITLAGSLDATGACDPVAFSDPYGSWPKVVATGNAKVTLKTAYVKINLENDLIYLPSGFPCKLSTEQCIDTDGAYTFWESVPQDFCSEKTYSKLFDGPAVKFESKEDTVYSVNVDDTSFSLKVTGSQDSCGVKLHTTGSPKLFLMKKADLSQEGSSIIADKNVNNLDMFQYVNAKFMYVEQHIRSQIKSLYLDVMRHHCRLEKEMLKNSLAIASTQPDEFAFSYMRGPGYMTVSAGEVLFIVQCVPVQVKFRHVDKCYNRLPISKGNDSLFLTPRTRIITKHATEVSCNSQLPEQYKLYGTWWKLTPEPMQAIPPLSLKPSTKITWTYQNIGNLATSGIYTQKVLDAMNDRIMSPVDNSVIATSVINMMSDGAGGPLSFLNAFDENLKEQIAEDIWSKTWGKFINFGTVFAGFIGIFVCFSLIKTVAESIINFYALYKVFGLSLNLLGALWDTVANILLSKEKEKKKQMEDNLSTTTLEFDNKPDIERGIDRETEVQNEIDYTSRVPTPAPRRFRE